MTSRGELADLRRKYDWLIALRERRVREGVPAAASELAALAREFPGALRELDRAPMELLRRRHTDLTSAEAGGGLASWIPVVAHYHRTLRTLLLRRADGTPPDRRGPTARAVASVADELGLDHDTVRRELGLRATAT